MGKGENYRGSLYISAGSFLVNNVKCGEVSCGRFGKGLREATLVALLHPSVKPTGVC